MNRPNNNEQARLEQTLRKLFQEDVSVNDQSKNWWPKAVRRATEQPQRRGLFGMGWLSGLRPLPALAMSFALVLVLGGGLVMASMAGVFGGGGDGLGEDPPLLARDVGGPTGGMTSMCINWESAVADGFVTYAFDGTVKSIEIRDVPDEFDPSYQEYYVTFDVNHWYRGGEGDEAGVWFSSLWLTESDMVLEPDNADLIRTGTRLLVSGDPHLGGPSQDDPKAATMCGNTKFYSSEAAAEWESAFAG